MGYKDPEISGWATVLGERGGNGPGGLCCCHRGGKRVCSGREVLAGEERACHESTDSDDFPCFGRLFWNNELRFFLMS